MKFYAPADQPLIHVVGTAADADMIVRVLSNHGWECTRAECPELLDSAGNFDRAAYMERFKESGQEPIGYGLDE